MKTKLTCFVLLFAAVAWAQSPPLTIGQYTAELRRYQQAVEQLADEPQTAPALIASVPDSVKIASGGREITVPLKFLRDSVTDFAKSTPQRKPTILKDLQTRLMAMQQEADAFDTASALPPNSREKLNQILAAREFNRARGPNALQVLKDKIGAWIDRQLAKLGRNLPSAEEAGPVFAWGMVAIACAILGVWLYRQARKREVEITRTPILFAPSEKHWRKWLEEAHAHAARGEWRDALHLAFWAGVSRLESEGTWRPDRTRTPREYLAAIPPSNSARDPFASVMRRFEAAWYGNRPTSQADFALTLGELEKLGCR